MHLVAALLLLAPQDLTVLKDKEEARKMLYAYLQGEAAKCFDARRKEVAALKTADDVRSRQARLKAQFIEALGGFPEKTPLNARVVGRSEYDGYRIERVLYESRPGHHVTAAFYLPEGKPPFPGVLVPCGHSENGKAAEAYQRASILMAKNGLAVLCYDPIGQGERKQLLTADGKAAIPGSTTEHTMVGIGALLTGTSCATYRIWDGIRSLDYLAGRTEVDPLRLGCTGNSGGGTLTAYLMALDERIVAAAPSCYITSLEKLLATIGPQDAEQNITRQIAIGLEHADYVTLRAPRATLICIGTQDYFDRDGAWTTFREAKQVYGILGHGERVDLFEYNDRHGFWKPRREAAMRWMRRWLLGADDSPVDPEYPVLKDAALQVTQTGQVLSDLKGRSCFDLNAEREKELAPARGKLSRAELLREVRRLIALKSRPQDPVFRSRAAEIEKLAGYTRTLTDYEIEPGIQVALARSEPARPGEGLPIVYVHDEGKAKAPALAWVRSGRTVVAADLRGWGETYPQEPRAGRPTRFGGDWKEAFLAVMLDRPLLGQRVYDLVELAARSTGGRGAHLVGAGAAAPVALHAAALDPQFKEVTLEGMVVSWSSVARATTSENQLANVVPGALKVYDLPDLAAALAPRPLAIKGPVDPMGKPVSQAQLEETYQVAREAYKAAGAEKALVLEAAR
jgi:dienelactone hydrolase